MLRWLRSRRLEIKYVAVGGIMLATLAGVAQTAAYTSSASRIAQWLDSAVAFGLMGLFAVSFTSNLTIAISIPSILIALSYVLINDAPTDILAFSLATGTGGALGKMIPYNLTTTMASRVRSMSESGIYRRLKKLIADHPRMIPVLVFGIAVTAMPLDLIVLPLALAQYPARKLFPALLAGKITHSLTLAVCTVWIIDLAGKNATPSLKIDVTLGIVIVSLLVMAYQIERSRTFSQSPRRAEMSSGV